MGSLFDIAESQKQIDAEIQQAISRASLIENKDDRAEEKATIRFLIDDLVRFAQELSGSDGMPHSPHECALVQYMQDRVQDLICNMIPGDDVWY